MEMEGRGTAWPFDTNEAGSPQNLFKPSRRQLIAANGVSGAQPAQLPV
jgi:hypothetical protein